MRLRAAFLCDAASIRETLLNVLGAGITQFKRHELPAPALVTYAAMVEASPGDAGRTFELKVGVYAPGEHGGEEVIIEHPVAATVEDYDDLGQSAQPLVVDLQAMPLLRYGTYAVRTFIDGEMVDEIRAECEP